MTLDQRVQDKVTLDQRVQDKVTLGQRVQDKVAFDQKAQNKVTLDQRVQDEATLGQRVLRTLGSPEPENPYRVGGMSRRALQTFRVPEGRGISSPTLHFYRQLFDVASSYCGDYRLK